MKRNISDRLFLFLGVFFTAVSLVALVALMQFKSKADSTNQRVNAGNEAPSFMTLVAAVTSGGGVIADFTPNEGTTKTLYVHGDLEDYNGCTDIDRLDLTVYRSGVGTNCGTDGSNCYLASAASSTFTNCAGGSDRTSSFEVTIAIKNYADPTDSSSPYQAENWRVSATTTDSSGATGQGMVIWEMNSLAAFNLYAAGVQNGTINYGTVALGATSAEKTLTFDNTGNRAVSSTVYANADMTSNLSGYDDIPTTAAHYASTTFTYGTGDTAVELFASLTPFDIYLSKQTSDASSTIPGYFQLKMPVSGVNGTYTNTLTLTAVP